MTDTWDTLSLLNLPNLYKRAIKLAYENHSD